MVAYGMILTRLACLFHGESLDGLLLGLRCVRTLDLDSEGP